MNKYPRVILLAIFLLSVALLIGPTEKALAFVIFTVNDPGDAVDAVPGDGFCATAGAVCTLRAAIQEANNNAGLDQISFSLTTSPYIISPGSALPPITDQLFIEGISQTGWVIGSPVVEIDGGGLTFDGLEFTASGNAIIGLVIRNFDGAAIIFSNSTGGSVIAGSFIGLNLAGDTAAGNTVGVHIINSSANIIGGAFAGEENVISGNGTGIIVQGAASDGNIITRNIIGLTAAGDASLGNTNEGILIDAAINTSIGSTNAEKRNTISSNGSHGISITNIATGTRVRGNRIGTDDAGSTDFGNSGDGILLDSSSNQIGGTSAGAKNIIRFNAGNGVTVAAGTNKNLIIGNNISSNSILGIDLNDDGITMNDVGDGDSGANTLMNYPVVSSATLIGTSLNIKGGYNGKGGVSIRLEFFSNTSCNASGNGEGANKIYAVKITTPGSGNETLDFSFSSSVVVGEYITATATRLLGGTTLADTSEFSACWPVSAGSPTATNTSVPSTAIPPTATSSGGGGPTATATSGIYTPTPSITPTFTITGTPPTATNSPTITPNIPQQTLTALATINVPSPTSTFLSFVSTRTPASTVNSGTGNNATATPTGVSLLTVGQLTATAEAKGSLGEIAGFDVTTIVSLCIGLAVLLLLAGGGVELVRWLNARRDENDGGEQNEFE